MHASSNNNVLITLIALISPRQSEKKCDQRECANVEQLLIQARFFFFFINASRHALCKHIWTHKWNPRCLRHTSNVENENWQTQTTHTLQLSILIHKTYLHSFQFGCCARSTQCDLNDVLQDTQPSTLHQMCSVNGTVCIPDSKSGTASPRHDMPRSRVLVVSHSMFEPPLSYSCTSRPQTVIANLCPWFLCFLSSWTRRAQKCYGPSCVRSFRPYTDRLCKHVLQRRMA